MSIESYEIKVDVTVYRLHQHLNSCLLINQMFTVDYFFLTEESKAKLYES